MAATIYPDYPPKLTAEQSANLLLTLKDWSIAHGLAVRPPPAFVSKEVDPEGVLAVTAPVTLFPSPFPRSCFEEGRSIQRAYNELYAAVARDEQWLERIIKEVIDVDDFIANLWDVHLKVKEEGYVQTLSLGLFRSDYMVHMDPGEASAQPRLKQVEFNTIASSFGGLSSQVSNLHRHLLSTSAYPPDPTLRPSALPPNDATDSLARGLAAAHTAYGASKADPPLPLCVLFVVQSPERNIFDQRHIEYALQAMQTDTTTSDNNNNTNATTPSNITVFRLAFADVLSQTRIPPDNARRPLLYTPPHAPSTSYEVTVLYFRATYTPADYAGPAAWRARLHLERSGAIKCPSILTHLAGSKKVQQVLATPSSSTPSSPSPSSSLSDSDLARFLSDASARAAVQDTFAAIYPLDDSSAGRTAKQLALDRATCGRFVLKPQREGGGNNVYRAAIPPFLRTLGAEDRWRGYILMELIEPPAQRNALFRDGLVKSGEVVAELGVYGTCLWDNSRSRSSGRSSGGSGDGGSGEEGGGGEAGNGWLLHNEEGGYLLRTKGRESEEGGVAAGFGAVDSVCLIDV